MFINSVFGVLTIMTIFHLLTLISLIFGSENYHPDQCNATRYKFAFFISNGQYLIHGLWVDQCQQCPTCGYPTCCNLKKFGNFTMPSDPSFIDQYWYQGRNPFNISTCQLTAKTLFEHEVVKHGSCMGLYANDYLKIDKFLYFEHQWYIIRKCNHSPSLRANQCIIDLDGNFQPIDQSSNQSMRQYSF